MRFVSYSGKGFDSGHQCSCSAETLVKPVNEFEILSQAAILDVHQWSAGNVNAYSVFN